MEIKIGDWSVQLVKIPSFLESWLDKFIVFIYLGFQRTDKIQSTIHYHRKLLMD